MKVGNDLTTPIGVVRELTIGKWTPPGNNDFAWVLCFGSGLTEKSVEYLPREQRATEALLQMTRSRKEQMNPDPTKMREPCAIFGQPFQPRSEILNVAHGIHIIDSGW